MKPISRLHLSPIDISLNVCKYSKSGMQIIFSPRHFEYKILNLPANEWAVCVCDYEISELWSEEVKITKTKQRQKKKCEAHSVSLKGGTRSCWVISSAWRTQAMLLPPPPAASTEPLRCPNVRPLLCFSVWYRSPRGQALAVTHSFVSDTKGLRVSTLFPCPCSASTLAFRHSKIC